MAMGKIIKPKVLVVIGSASRHSSNLMLMKVFQQISATELEVTIIDNLHTLPHFDPLLADSPPFEVQALQHKIESSDGIVFCTPEYIFSIPSRLKNLLEWCVSTTIFSDKPVGVITASADGARGHAELLLLVETLGASITEESSLLIKGIKGKFDENMELRDMETQRKLVGFLAAFRKLLKK